MAALVIVALFWGNCFSCPQILLSLKTHNLVHQCCKRGQKPVTTNCQNQGMQHFLKTDTVKVEQAAAAPVSGAVPEGALVVVELPRFAPAVVEVATHASPDLLSLHSSFRI